MDPSQSSAPDQAAGNVDDSFSNELRFWSGNSNGHAVESEQMENDNVHINCLCVFIYLYS